MALRADGRLLARAPLAAAAPTDGVWLLVHASSQVGHGPHPVVVESVELLPLDPALLAEGR